MNLFQFKSVFFGLLHNEAVPRMKGSAPSPGPEVYFVIFTDLLGIFDKTMVF